VGVARPEETRGKWKGGVLIRNLKGVKGLIKEVSVRSSMNARRCQRC